MKLRSNPVTIKAVQSILLQLNYDAIHKKRSGFLRNRLILLVGATGFEPVTPAV